MSDARWLDVDEDVAAASEHFSNALVLYRIAKFDESGIEGYRDQMAFMHAMQSGHMSAEAALLKILGILDEEEPLGGDWHQKLISRLARAIEGDHKRPALLPAEVAADLDETRAFRHRAMHSYGRFEAARSGPSLAAARRLVPSLSKAIADFRAIVDPK